MVVSMQVNHLDISPCNTFSKVKESHQAMCHKQTKNPRPDNQNQPNIIYLSKLTHISVMFSLSCGASTGMLLMLSTSKHWSMAKEHRQALGQLTQAPAARVRIRNRAKVTRHTALPAMLSLTCPRFSSPAIWTTGSLGL